MYTYNKPTSVDTVQSNESIEPFSVDNSIIGSTETVRCLIYMLPESTSHWIQQNLHVIECKS